MPPESAAIDLVAREMGIGAGTLERWREEARSRPARGRAWTAAGRLEAVVTTAAMNEADTSAWCRSHGAYPQELAQWRASATTALAAPQEMRASPQATRADRLRIKELERELLRKDRALAETAALLVLSKKVVLQTSVWVDRATPAGLDRGHGRRQQGLGTPDAVLLSH